MGWQNKLQQFHSFLLFLTPQEIRQKLSQKKNVTTSSNKLIVKIINETPFVEYLHPVRSIYESAKLSIISLETAIKICNYLVTYHIGVPMYPLNSDSVFIVNDIGDMHFIVHFKEFMMFAVKNNNNNKTNYNQAASSKKRKHLEIQSHDYRKKFLNLVKILFKPYWQNNVFNLTRRNDDSYDKVYNQIHDLKFLEQQIC